MDSMMREAAEMVADKSVRYVPAQPSFGRNRDALVVESDSREAAAEWVGRASDALAALGARGEWQMTRRYVTTSVDAFAVYRWEFHR